MAGYKTLLLVFTYAIFYCAADDKPKPLIPDPHEWMIPKENMGNTLVTLINKWLVHKENDVKKILKTQLKQYTLTMGIDVLVREVFDNTNANPELTALNVALSELGVLFGKIDDVYETHLIHKGIGKNATDSTLRFWLDQTRSPYTGPLNYINEIFTRTVLLRTDASTDEVEFQSNGTVLSRLSKYVKGYKRLCNMNKSQQQILHILYNTIMIAVLKVYTILNFCYRKLAKIGATNYNYDIKLLRAQVLGKKNRTTTIFKQFMHASSREVWRCDPEVHVEDETYAQLYNVFQKFVVHDNDVNNKHTCTKTCDSIDHGEVTNCDKSNNRKSNYDIKTQQDEKSICDQQRPCNGFLYECEDYFANHDDLWICPSALNSTRRYEFMMHGSIDFLTRETLVSNHYGHEAEKSDCSRNMTYDVRTFGSTFEDLYRNCEICLCTCVDFENRNSDNLVDIRPVIARENYIITGVRLVKANHILHIRIEQGKLLEDGQIDSSTIHWKEVEPVTSAEQLQVIDHRCKGIYLGVTDVDNDRVIVGVRLAKIVDTDGQLMIGLKTHSAPYDFHSGGTQRFPKASRMPFDEPNSPVKISESARVELIKPDIPTKCEFENLPQTDTMRIVNLTTTDFEKDLGQTLVPFFDIQEVKVRPAVPLSGIGFYHKGREGYGGFVGIKLLTYDYSFHLD